jgi:hypothetical protein
MQAGFAHLAYRHATGAAASFRGLIIFIARQIELKGKASVHGIDEWRFRMIFDSLRQMRRLRLVLDIAVRVEEVTNDVRRKGLWRAAYDFDLQGSNLLFS